MESLEIQLIKDIINKKDGARLNNAWLPALEQWRGSSTAVGTELSRNKRAEM